MNKNYNLLFIWTDQQRFDTLAAYGNTKIKVPNLNKLAQRSVVFKRTYVTQPVCTPSRGSIMTGLYPHNHGSYLNNIALDASIPTIAELAAGSGYRTAYMGKWHLGDEMVRQHGFDEWVSTEEYRKFMSKPEYRKLNSSYYSYLYNKGYRPDNEGKDFRTFSRPFATRLPKEDSKPAFTAREACRFLEENKDGKFMLYVNFLEPHPPYNSAYDDMYDPMEVDLPPMFLKEQEDNKPLKYRYSQKYYREVGRQGAMNDDEMIWRKLIAKYWGATTLIDEYAGVIIDKLSELGLDKNTIIVFTSDHGDMMGDYGMLQKYVMYDSAARVPFLFSVPGFTDNQKIIDEPVSTIDIVPTLLDFMGIKTDAKLDGKSLKSVICGQEQLVDNDVFYEWNGDEGEDIWFNIAEESHKERIEKVYGAAVRAVVTPDKFKFCMSAAGEHELYDLNSDPYEQCNLYGKPEYEAKAAELMKKLEDWIVRTGDKIAQVVGRN